MPYYTRKGTGKDKGKTCVYKKENDKKVGCTDGPVKDYLAALHTNANESIDKASKITKSELKQIILQEVEIYKKEYEKFPPTPSRATLEYKLARAISAPTESIIEEEGYVPEAAVFAAKKVARYMIELLNQDREKYGGPKR